MSERLAHAGSRRETAIEFCHLTREQRARTDRSTRHVVQAALAAGLTPAEVASHTGMSVEEVRRCNAGNEE